MDSANWLTGLGQALRFVVQSIPDAFWVTYDWAKEWQVFLGGTLVLIAAQIYAHASIRAARIRAAASIRAAQIATGAMPGRDERSEPTFSKPNVFPARQESQHRAERDLATHKLEQVRSLIRSAMALLAADVDGADATGNIYCERIARLRFEEADMPHDSTATTLDLYKRFLLQLATVRRVSERKFARTDLTEALFQLNARARELAAALESSTTRGSTQLARRSGQVRG